MMNKEALYAEHFARNRERLLAATIVDAEKIAELTREDVAVIEHDNMFVAANVDSVPDGLDVVAIVKTKKPTSAKVI